MATIKERLPELEDRYFIMYQPELANYLGSVNEAIFVCFMALWQGKGEDGKWVYKSIKDLKTQTGLSRGQMETVEKKLKEKDLLETKTAWINNYSKVKHYKIKWKELKESIAKERWKRPQEVLMEAKRKIGII